MGQLMRSKPRSTSRYLCNDWMLRCTRLAVVSLLPLEGAEVDGSDVSSPCAIAGAGSVGKVVDVLMLSFYTMKLQ